ncbi:MAG: hypothetical protein AABX13_01700 [Nanoarchaeota archaeon]
MTNTTIFIGLITLLIESLGLLFIKGKDRLWLFLLLLATVIVFGTVYVLQRTG